MLNLEYFGADGPVSTPGIFIPIQDLPGVTIDEISNREALFNDSSIALAMLQKLFARVPEIKPLGLTVSKPLPVVISANTWNQSYIINTVLMGNYTNNLLSPIPVPAGNEDQGNGNAAITNVFSGAMKLAAGMPTGGAGVLIPSAELANYGATPHAGIDLSAMDNRGWLFALVNYIVNVAARRVDNGRSAIISANKTANSILTPPASFTATDNPLTSVLTTELPLRVFLTTTYTLVVQLNLDQDSQTFDVNILDS